jgi:hypothetical protein
MFLCSKCAHPSKNRRQEENQQIGCRPGRLLPQVAPDMGGGGAQQHLQTEEIGGSNPPSWPFCLLLLPRLGLFLFLVPAHTVSAAA